MKGTTHVEIVLVGGGPACVSAAVQLSRCKREILVVSPEVGGCVRYARNLENLAGFPTGIPGPAFAERLRRQAEHFRIPRLEARATSIEYHEGLFHIRTEKESLTCTTAIVGSGTQPESLGIPGEEKAIQAGRVIHHPEELDSRATTQALVVGGGDVACEYALNLAEKGISVRMVVRGEQFRALERLRYPVMNTPGISVNFSTNPLAILNGEKGISLRARSGNGEMTMAADALIVAVGRRSNLDFLSPELRPGTNHPRERFFLVGDAAHPHHRQVAMAIGDGMRAAMEIIAPINGEPDED